MRVNELVRDYGIEKAKQILEFAPSNATHFDAKSRQYYRFKPEVLISGGKYFSWSVVADDGKYIFNHGYPCDLISLRMIVGSFTLVESFGGIEKSKEISKGNDLHRYLRDSIADVESCQ